MNMKWQHKLWGIMVYPKFKKTLVFNSLSQFWLLASIWPFDIPWLHSWLALGQVWPEQWLARPAVQGETARIQQVLVLGINS